ncbi:MAG: cellulase family glycosylhydrolase [Candidatus Shapirobacteria bacterium]|jgi:hypothetical protein
MLLALLLLLSLFSPQFSLAQDAGCDASLSRSEYFDKEIQEFTSGGAFAYLVWQYSGDKGAEFENDKYSFFRRDPKDPDQLLCQTLKKHEGKVGVNIHGLANKQDSVLNDHLGYLRNNCGVTYVRFWGFDRNIGQIKNAVTISNNLGIKSIIALADYSNGSTDMPASIHSDPTSWYSSGGHNQYLNWIKNVAQELGDSVFIYELANEPHCNGVTSCPPVYNSWAAEAAGIITSIVPGAKVSIGQMASQSTTLGDSPPTDYQNSNSTGSISYASAHYYTESEKNNAKSAMGVAQSISKQFYIGEAGQPTSCPDVPLECDIDSSDPPPIIIDSSYVYGPPTSGADHPNDLHHNNVSNDIEKNIADGNYVKCTFNLNATAEVKPSNCLVYDENNNCTQYAASFIETAIAQVKIQKALSNLGSRQSQKQKNSQAIGELDMSDSQYHRVFTNYGNNYVGSLEKALPQAQKNQAKDNRLLEAVKNRQNMDSKNLDEQVAWGCGTRCVSIGCKKQDSCRPIWMSEVAYVLNKTPQHNSFLSGFYSSTPRVSQECYQKIYKLLEVQSAGSVDTKIETDSAVPGGGTKTVTTKQADPNYNAFNGELSSNLLPASFKKGTSSYVDKKPEDVCKVENLGSRMDEASPTFFEVALQISQNISEKLSLSEPKQVSVYIPKNVVDGNRIEDTVLVNRFFPEFQAKELKDKPASSVNNNQSPTHLGNRNEEARKDLTKKLWPGNKSYSL